MRLLRASLAVLVVAFATRAAGFPAFAKKYGMSCSACHVAWPILNMQGVNFRDNGYQFGLGKDDPVQLPPAYVPIALRTVPAYAFTRATDQPSDAGPVTVQSGGVEPPGVDVLTGGAIAKDVSFLVVLAGFAEDEPAGVESAWARLDSLGGSPWLNVRLGKHELDLPASSHRGITLTSGYAVYGGHPAGSIVPFDLGENQLGVELSGHSARSETRYALSLVTANGGEGMSGNAWSSPFVYGHLQQAFDVGSPALSWLQVGVLGAVGWWPTRGALLDGEPLPGTGAGHKRFYRAGAELSGILGHPATPLFFTVAFQWGREEEGLASGADPDDGTDLATVTNSFTGGFVEVDWVPVSESSYDATPYVIFARYDMVRPERGGSDLDGGTIGVRRYLALGPRASAAIHLELHADRVKRSPAGFVEASGIPRDVTTEAVLLGVDFDY
jgi:hypothetical protein